MSRDLVEIAGLNHRYRNVAALTDIDLNVPQGKLIGVVGADGVGKSTLLSIVAGVTKIQSGSVKIFERDLAEKESRNDVRARLGFMPQGLGQNLYGDLSVRENIAFFASLFGIRKSVAETRQDELLAATELTAFSHRRAADLSGGMKQKLGLCTILIHEPDLLILDEPTTGVDPLSRRNFWLLIRNVMRRKAATTLLVATADLGEAESFDWLVMMDAGRIIATGTPLELMQRADAATLEEVYETLHSGDANHRAHNGQSQRLPGDSEIVIEAIDLTRRFGNFTAVDRVNFHIRRGEIYGFIGPNGSGKTTTMKMLTGLLPPSAGTARIFGHIVEAASTEWRHRLGYMSQMFSLYSELTVKQNLEMHGRIFDLRRCDLQARIAELAREFDLDDYMDQLASRLPVGIRQRLSLAIALIHGPDLLVLDEPTSGVDPLARDKLWTTLRKLSADRGTTVFVSTHYLGEAERCDQVALMNEGRLLTADTPQALLRDKNVDSFEDAFVAFIEDDRDQRRAAQIGGDARQ